MAKFKDLGDKLSAKYKCALVTGGAGFIGSHVCEELLENTNLMVVSLDNYSAGKKSNTDLFRENPRFVDIEGDVLDEKLLKTLFGKYEIDIVFHNAASKKNICLHDPKKDLDVNGKGTLNLLLVSKEHNVKKFVHASTGSVYGEAQYFPQDEKHPLIPASFYGVSKLAGEKYVKLFNKLYGMNTTVLRYFHVYGTRQESNEFGGVVAIFMRNMIKNENPVIHGDGTQERSFTYVKDVVQANFVVAIDGLSNGEVYNCASGIKVSIKHLCDLIIRGAGKADLLKPVYEDWLIGDIKVFDVDNRKLSSLGVSFDRDFDDRVMSVMKQTIDLIK